MIYDETQAILVLAAEFITDERIEMLHQSSVEKAVVGLTYNRANVLKVLPREKTVALVHIASHMSAGVIQAMADPADDLDKPMLGPFKVSDRPAGAVHMAGILLCKHARVLPAAVFSGPLALAGIAAEGNDAPVWAAAHGLLAVKTTAIEEHLYHDALSMKIVTSAPVPLEDAPQAQLVAFRPEDGGTEHFAVIIGAPNRHEPVLTRIHSECFTGDLLGSLKCDCGEQLRGAIAEMSRHGQGVLLYLAQEGRGIGLINKLRAYHLQAQGFDTVDSNERLGFQDDERIFEPAAEMLKLLGFQEVELMTNNPRKVVGLEACGIKVRGRRSHKFPSNTHNAHYLQTKKKRSGHLL